MASSPPGNGYASRARNTLAQQRKQLLEKSETPEEFLEHWKRLKKLCFSANPKTSLDALKLYLSYTIGKPTQIIDLTTTVDSSDMKGSAQPKRAQPRRS